MNEVIRVEKSDGRTALYLNKVKDANLFLSSKNDYMDEYEKIIKSTYLCYDDPLTVFKKDTGVIYKEDPLCKISAPVKRMKEGVFYQAKLELVNPETNEMKTYSLKYFNSHYEAKCYATMIYSKLINQEISSIVKETYKGKHVEAEVPGNFLELFKSRASDELCDDEILVSLRGENNALRGELETLKKHCELLENENERVNRERLNAVNTLEIYKHRVYEDVCTCPDCGAERIIMSSHTNQRFIGCSSGEHHKTRPYDSLGKICHREGLLRTWDEFHGLVPSSNDSGREGIV